jgi:hypothetical protein
MAPRNLQVGYSGTFVAFTDFAGEDLPRSILQQATLDFSGLGAAYSSGTAKKQRRIWAVAAYGSLTQWNTLMQIFDAWDAARVTGTNIAEVIVVDNLLGSTVTTLGFFTTAPTIAKVAPGNNQIYLISFGITET